FRGELAFALRRKILILLPLLPHLLLLLGRQRLERFVLLARDRALLRGQLRPRAHLLLNALLLIGLHRGITLRDAAPLLFARAVQLVPIGCERREDLLFIRRQLAPGRGLEGDLGLRGWRRNPHDRRGDGDNQCS